MHFSAGFFKSENEEIFVRETCAEDYVAIGLLREVILQVQRDMIEDA